jgi:DNA-binding PadR family transcriptional regulator
VNERDYILAKVLATGDAAFLPVREFARPGVVNRADARRHFSRLGAAWDSGSTSDAHRKKIERALDAAVKAGLLTTSKPRRAKTLFAKLTPAGERLARGLVGNPGLRSAWWTLHEVAKHTSATPRTFDEKWLPEIALAGLKCWGETVNAEARQELMLVEAMALPAMEAGWLTTNSDGSGRAYYAATATGREAVDAGEPEEDLHTPDPDARAQYHESLLEAIRRLDMKAQERSGEIGPLPLPVHHVGVAL